MDDIPLSGDAAHCKDAWALEHPAKRWPHYLYLILKRLA